MPISGKSRQCKQSRNQQCKKLQNHENLETKTNHECVEYAVDKLIWEVVAMIVGTYILSLQSLWNQCNINTSTNMGVWKLCEFYSLDFCCTYIHKKTSKHDQLCVCWNFYKLKTQFGLYSLYIDHFYLVIKQMDAFFVVTFLLATQMVSLILEGESWSGQGRLSPLSDRWVSVNGGWLCFGNRCMSFMLKRKSTWFKVNKIPHINFLIFLEITLHFSNMSPLDLIVSALPTLADSLFRCFTVFFLVTMWFHYIFHSIMLPL